MTTVYTELPTKHKGEQDLAQQLTSFNDPKLHLWFGLDFIPGVEDIDILLWHEDVGVFAIEVKALPISMIEEFGWKYCKIKGRGVSEGPQYQAYQAQESLRKYLESQMKPPYIVSTACWPLISRESWDRMWDDERIKGNYSKTMIFQEDLFAGESDFVNRLKHIYNTPPVRKGSAYTFFHRQSQLEELAKQLSPISRQKAAPSDLERLRILEKRTLNEASDEAPIGQGIHLLYQGYPGTGKTFRLLAIGYRHVLRHQRVLFICFNKVLAADIRRTLSYSQTLSRFSASIEVFDLYEFLYKHSIDASLDIDPLEDVEIWGTLIAEYIIQRSEMIPKYDTILIDEAQDVPDWSFAMLQAIAQDNAAICIAVGKGQELYTKSPKWLEIFRKQSILKQLRRNFRNTLPVFQVAQIFYESNLKHDNISKVLKRFSSKRTPKDTELPEFERPEGQPPLLVRINDNMLVANHGMSVFDDQESVMVAEYARIINQQLESLVGDLRPLDLLVLVPDRKGLERHWALQALKQLHSKRDDFKIVDYTDEKNRRIVAASNTIRLCTFHSARGLEAMRVVIFGFEFIERTAKSVDVAITNLGYIVLTRSLFENVIAIRADAQSAVIPFLEATLRALPLSQAEPSRDRLM